jgi:hypothetical protein
LGSLVSLLCWSMEKPEFVKPKHTYRRIAQKNPYKKSLVSWLWQVLVLVGFVQPIFLYTSGKRTCKASLCPHCAFRAFHPPLFLENKLGLQVSSHPKKRLMFIRKLLPDRMVLFVDVLVSCCAAVGAAVDVGSCRYLISSPFKGENTTL